MRRTIIIFSCILHSFLTMKCQSFLWSNQARFNNPTGGTFMVHDQTYNTYVVGEYEPARIYLNETSPTGSFFTKYDTSGTARWTKTSTSKYLTLAIGPDDMLYVAGMDSTGYFISKYDTAGTQLSRTTVLTRTTNVTRAMIKGIGVDNSNNYYICGSFCDTMCIGSYTAYSSPRFYKMFVAKFNSSDVCQWIQSSNSVADVICFAVDASGNTYVGGEYMLNFAIGSTELTTTAYSAGFIAKFNSSGSFQWLYEVDGKQQQYVRSIDIDNSGNVFATGYFDIALSLGLAVSGNPNAEIFLIKLNSSGTLLWARKMGGAGGDYANAIKVNSGGDVYLAGAYEHEASFGTSITLESTSGVRWEPFVVKYDPNGNPVWAMKAGCAPNAQGYCSAISLDPSENIFITGSFVGKVDFDNHPVNNDEVSMFITKIKGETATGWLETPNAIFGKGDPLLSCMPNPVSDKVTFIYMLPPGTSGGIRVTDIVGKEVTRYHVSVDSRLHEADVSAWSNGVYFYSMIVDNKITATGKLIITK